MESGKRLQKVRRGDPYRASFRNDLIDAIEAGGKLSAQGATVSKGPSGTVVNASEPDVLFAKVTAIDGSGRCSWVEQVPSDNGAWLDGSFSGGPDSIPAYEANGVTPDSFPFRAILQAVGPSSYFFFWDQCS